MQWPRVCTSVKEEEKNDKPLVQEILSELKDDYWAENLPNWSLKNLAIYHDKKAKVLSIAFTAYCTLLKQKIITT